MKQLLFICLSTVAYLSAYADSLTLPSISIKNNSWFTMTTTDDRGFEPTNPSSELRFITNQDADIVYPKKTRRIDLEYQGDKPICASIKYYTSHKQGLRPEPDVCKIDVCLDENKELYPNPEVKEYSYSREALWPLNHGPVEFHEKDSNYIKCQLVKDGNGGINVTITENPGLYQ